MYNENKNLSRNRKRRNERNFKLDDKLKTLLYKTKSEKKKKIKIFDKIKQLEMEFVKIKYVNIPNNLQSYFKRIIKISRG